MNISAAPDKLNVRNCSACKQNHERIYPSRDAEGYYFNCPVNQKRVDISFKVET